SPRPLPRPLPHTAERAVTTTHLVWPKHGPPTHFEEPRPDESPAPHPPFSPTSPAYPCIGYRHADSPHRATILPAAAPPCRQTARRKAMTVVGLARCVDPSQIDLSYPQPEHLLPFQFPNSATLL